LAPAFVLFSLIIFQGCAAGPGIVTSEVSASIGSGKVDKVPFYPQVSFQCGPASLAGVLSFFGEGVTPEEIAEAIFRRDIRGVVTLDMLLYARKRGFFAEWYNGSLEDIRRSVDERVPLIVMVDFGFAGIRKNHFMVVVGYTPEGVIANSGKTREKLISWEYFRARWNRTKRWALRIEQKEAP
jgi:ABC-type bacteriocin/lantibiotic exporter with double-glycine peptidase domain